MTVAQTTDASFTTPPLTWQAIGWPSVRQAVRRLQMRIAKATKLHRSMAARHPQQGCRLPVA